MSDTSGIPSRLEAISTRWSLLQQAQACSATASVEACNALVLRYQPAIRRYVRAMVTQAQDAEDLAQDVLVRLLSGDFAGADPQRGRFRDLLKLAIRNMVRNYWTRQKRRRTADLDADQLAGAEDDADDAAWTSAWRRSVLDLAWNALKQQDRNRPNISAYAVLRLRTEYPDDSSEQLAARLGEKLGEPIRADAVRQRLRRARVQFADLLIAEIARGLETPTPERIEEELVALGLIEFLRDVLPGARENR